MAGPGLIYFNPALYGKEDQLLLKWSITGAKTVSPLPINNSAVYTVADAIAAQSTIDNFLGSTNEFLIAQFDATSMGTDAFGCLINMSGESSGVSGTVSATTMRAQAASVLCMEISLYSGSQGATVVNEGVVAVSTLTSTSLTTQVACGSAGNIAFRAILSGLDNLTSGLIVARIHWVSV
jgi:hypothetical protein